MIGKRLLYDDLIDMVRTWTEPLQELSLTHQIPRDQQSGNSDSSEESDLEDCPFTYEGGTEYELPDDHNCSDDDCDIFEDYGDSLTSTQTAEQEKNLTQMTRTV